MYIVGFLKREVEILKEKFFLKTHTSKNLILSENDFFEKAKGFNGIISQGNVINKKFINYNKKCLRAISNVGVGYDNIDVEANNQKRIAVFNTPNIMNHAVADLTIGLIIAISRKICLGNNYIKNKTGQGILGIYFGEIILVQEEKLGIID